MLWNRRFCFLHYPKTAGKSLTRYFLTVLERPVTAYVSAGQMSEVADVDLTDVNLQIGRGHENMSQANEILAGNGRTLDSLDAIFVAIRNPYDLMVSNYFYMREHFKGENIKRNNFQIAANNNFSQYCEKVGVSSPANWMELDHKPLDNLWIIRFEEIEENLEIISAKFNLPVATLSHLNKSKRKHFSEYVTDRSEKAIYAKFKYIFDKGYYRRFEGL